MTFQFTFSAIADGGEIRLSEQKLFGRRTIPPAQWPEAGDQTIAPALRLIRKLMMSGKAWIQDDSVSIPTSNLVDAPGSVLTMLGLPPVAPLSLSLSLRGRIEAADGQIGMRWTDDTFREVTPTRKGLVVRFAGREGRLTPRLTEMLDAIDGYNDSLGADAGVRLQGWATVQTQLESLAGGPIDADNILKSYRIYQTGSFALDVRETPDGIEIDPIPMSRGMRPSLADETPAPENGADAEDDIRDSLEHALLPPELQRQFQKAFNEDGLATRPAYVLGRSTYLVMDPEVQSALDVLKRAQRAPLVERRAFVRNPRAALVAAMPETGEAVGTLFVETRQYSERVVGLGLWQKPVLEWIKKQSAGWLPETFQLLIGDQTLKMTAEGFERLGANFDKAVADEQKTFPFDGHVISVDAAAVALERIREGGFVADASTEVVAKDQPTPDPNVLLIEENIESSEFQRSIRPRPLFAQKLFPSDFVVTVPKPHQIDGFGWLVDAWTAGLPGTLLADDMGLGKTMQALAFLVWVRQNLRLAADRGRELTGPILIVAPTALLRNWQKEAATHLAPEALGVCVEVFGSGLTKLKRSGQPPEDAIDVNALRDADWILTTYETLANYHRAFARVGFSVAVFDEMQKIKAPDTINTHAAKTMNADFVLGMTGTPIENRIEDLWCIMDRVAPGFLGALKPFSKMYGDNDAEGLKQLKAKLDAGGDGMPAIMLRRMKHDHLRGLPERKFQVYGEPAMPPVQAAAYQAIVEGASVGAGGRKLEMLKTVHALRGISLHPLGGASVDPYDATSATEWINQSARLKQVIDILSGIQATGEKALVFIEDRAIQAAFAAVAAAQLRLDREPDIINGETAADERQAIVDRFQSRPKGFDLLVLSPKAAGIGLTITAANHVIHLSRWWNPAVEDQCNDRVFRIGQDKPVTVHIPMAVHPTYGDDSFDIKLNALLERKRTLSRDMLAPPVSDSDASELFGQTVGASAHQ
jgi:hypothetical protein